MTAPEPCRAFEDDLPAWRAGALPDAQARARDAHLAGCARCAALVAEDEALDARLEPALADALDRRLAARIDALGIRCRASAGGSEASRDPGAPARHTTPPAPRRAVPWRWVAVLAFGAFLAVCADLRRAPPPPPPAPPWRPAPPLPPEQQPPHGLRDPRPEARGSWEQGRPTNHD